MISYKEALEIIKKEFVKLEINIEEVPLEEASLRTLAEDIYADINLPPFDNSAVDGIAFRFDETVTKWKLTGEISAGNFSDIKVDSNTAVTIMTGSRLPDSCDSVLPIEDIEINGELASLKPGSIIKKGMNVRRLGSDIKINEKALSKNTLIKSRHLAALASCGKNSVKVFKKMKISVLATGDELIEVNSKPDSDKIRVSNIYSLCGIINELNQSAENLGFVGDDRAKLKSKLNDLLNSDTDIIITTGGVSVGKFDYVKDLFKELGVEEKFWRSYIKPGKPAFFGTFNSNGKIKLVFGLPGNPVSSLVNFELYIKPYIIDLYGLKPVQKVNAVLENDLRKKDNKRHFIKAFISQDDDDTYKVVSQISQSSGNLVELSKANCLIEVEEERLNPCKGETVQCILI